MQVSTIHVFTAISVVMCDLICAACRCCKGLIGYMQGVSCNFAVVIAFTIQTPQTFN